MPHSKVHTVLREFKKGKLKSGSGAKVKSRKQAIAIALSEARRRGEKVSPQPRETGRGNPTLSKFRR